jgi:hypothetical protein
VVEYLGVFNHVGFFCAVENCTVNFCPTKLLPNGVYDMNWSEIQNDWPKVRPTASVAFAVLDTYRPAID